MSTGVCEPVSLTHQPHVTLPVRTSGSVCPCERVCAHSTPGELPLQPSSDPAGPHRPASSYSAVSCLGHAALHPRGSPAGFKVSSGNLANTHHQWVTVHSHLGEVSPGQPGALALWAPSSGENPAWLAGVEAMTARCPGHSKLVAGKTCQFPFHCKKHHYRTYTGPQEPGNPPSTWTLRPTVVF